MNHHASTRIPVNVDYALLVGKAVYAFAYYEWTIIWIIKFLESGFVSEYSRERPMTSGAAQQRLKNAIDHLQSEPNGITTVELNSCLSAFSGLVIKRNALIHARPYTDVNGSQVLAYQTQPSKPLPYMKWPVSEVHNTIAEIDATACDTGTILDKLRS